MKKRGEFIERSFAHTLETGAMRRTHLRHHENILKRMLIHVGGFNLSLVMRKLLGIGKPRRLQGVCASVPKNPGIGGSMVSHLRHLSLANSQRSTFQLFNFSTFQRVSEKWKVRFSANFKGHPFEQHESRATWNRRCLLSPAACAADCKVDTQ